MKLTRLNRSTRFKRTIGFVLPYLPLEIGIIFIMLITVGLGLLDPIVLKILIDNVLINQNVSLLNVLVIGLIFLLVLRGGMNIVTNYLTHFISQRILFDVRFKLFKHLEKLHIGFFTENKTGEIISRVQNDVSRIQNVLTSTLISLTTDFVTFIAILGIIIWFNWKLAIISLSLIPFFFVTQLYLGRRIKKKSRESRDKSAEIVSFFQEVFTSMKLVQSFVKERFEAIRLLRKSRELINLRINVGVLAAVAGSVAGFLSALGPMAVIWYGGHQVINGNLSIGSLVAFYAYVGRLYGPIFRLAQHNISIQSARAALDRIFEFFEIESEITDSPGCITLNKVKGHIIFNNVDFSYNDDETILKSISFQIKPGQKIAIVGPSGAGKTTIINLLCRFYDPGSGSILLDGNDIRNIRLSCLRNHIGIVSQETILLNTSIRENILYGNRKATETEMVHAAEKAHIREFIESLPEKYETIVGERGVRLSGGQCQRLSIARTILKDPGILVFDEAMSSIDTKSESIIQKAIEPLIKGKTAIIVAHRLSSITDSDDILVLHKGKLSDRGKHSELLVRGGIYKTLWEHMNLTHNVL